MTRATEAGYTSDPALHFFLERYAAAYQAELQQVQHTLQSLQEAQDFQRRLEGEANPSR